jgi:hypothetical protein
MEKSTKVRYSTRKYDGDDQYSWAVFASNQTHPVVTGCSRSEAQYHKKKLEKKG